jgi:glycosyltransferase involved in cell wall biosynthesis
MELNSQPLVSIVTPVYNGEKHLAECIESVLAQTYQNWEYVIVNNCSTDRTLEIAENYAKNDARIRIHNNEKLLKALQNFNHTLRQISPNSKYCKELHADDWLFPECLMEMVKVAESNPSVGIVGSYALRNTKVVLDGLPYLSTFRKGKEVCRSILLGGPNVLGTPTSHLIRSDIIRNSKSFYNESHIYADIEAYLGVLQNYDFGFVHKVLTFWRLHEEQRSTFAGRFNTYIAANIYMLFQYGTKCLSSEEYKKCFHKLISDYYRFLAKSLFIFKKKEFWDYHRKELNEIGAPLSIFKLLIAFFLEFMDILLNPKRTFEKIIDIFLRKNRKQMTPFITVDEV